MSYADGTILAIILDPEDVSPQSLRALDKMADSRGPEPLRDALEWLAGAIRSGRSVTLSYSASEYEYVSE